MKKVAVPPPVAEVDNEVVERKICRKEKDERVLEVIPRKRGCVLHYTKSGITDEMAHSVRNVTICQGALKRIADNLTGAGFQCE